MNIVKKWIRTGEGRFCEGKHRNGRGVWVYDYAEFTKVELVAIDLDAPQS